MALRQEKVMIAAVQLAGGDLPLIQGYYSEKKWLAAIPKIKKRKSTDAPSREKGGARGDNS